MKQQLGPTDIFFPVPAALIVSGPFRQVDIITIAWVGMVSSTPPTVGISLDKRRYSLELIRSTGEFSVNIPDAAHFEEADFCGMVSGRKVDKFVQSGLTPLAAGKLKTAIIKECPFNMECRVIREIELGDYVLILGEVLETHIDEDKVDASNNRPQIDIAKTNPLVYCATVREYWSLGSKLGKAFQAGKTILDQGEDSRCK